MKLWTLNRNSALLACAMLLGLGSVGCEQDCDSCEPAAPHDLAAQMFKSGIHLTWEDASDNENNFIVERWARSSAGSTALYVDLSAELSARPEPPSEVQAFGVHFIELVELPENTEDYLDTDIDPGLTYVYRTRAVNDAGSSLSDELEVTVP